MKKKLLIFSDSPFLQTGYANISMQIAKRLVDHHGWEVVWISHNYTGRTLDKDEVKGQPYKLYGRGVQEFCKDVLQPVIRKEQPSIVLTLLDTFMVFPWFTEIDFAPARSIFYYPVDGEGCGVPVNCEHVLSRMTLPVSMSKHGQELVKRKHGINAAYIPHAVDSKHYRPFDQNTKNVLRAEWGLTGKFVVGVVARNQNRKMLDRTMISFAMFCKDKPDAVLLMHSDPYDAAAPWDLTTLIRQLGIENRVVWTGTTFYNGFPYDKMPHIYNLMDVFFLTTSGEGWGVPTTEAMSSEVPVVVTDYTTTKEMVVDHEAGFGVKVAAEVTGSWLVNRAIMSDEDAVDKLNKLYYDKGLREKMGKNGRKAVLSEYDWDVVMPQWNALLESLLRY